MRRTTPLRILLPLVLVLASACPHAAVAATSSDLAAHQRAAAEARRKAAEEQKKADALVAETQRLEAQIGSARARRVRLEAEIQTLRASIASKQEEIASVKATYEERVAALSARVDATYRAGDWVYIDWLLTASDISDLLERTSLIQRLIREDENIAKELETSRAQLETAELDLNRSLDEVSAKKAEVAAEENRQRSAQNRKQALLAETKENVAQLKAIADAEDRESARIASLLRGSGWSRGSGKYAGKLVWPAPGNMNVGSRFGMRYHPILHYNRMHSGIDVSAPSGAPLVAVGSGRVQSAGWSGGYGNCVMIDHGDGLVSVYAHMSRIGVRTGQGVAPGEAIGAVGSTGLSTGPHLHFEIRVNGTAVNPLDYY
jgi:murein DD-endopeptidase MepM/ murein hydrolase activator NlpD